MDLAEGKIIAGHYQLLKQLGQGSFGDVWLAHNMLADIDVAIKFYGSFDKNGLSEFRNEFRLAYKLNHPNLLNISHFDVCENCPYLVMPYCANGSVGKRTGKMAESEIWKFVHDVAGGMAFLHSQQPAVIHQDIKPDNILITSDGRYVISDFGISRNLRTRLSRTVNKQNSSGTQAYMGPERFSEHPLVVLASDIWAFGMTLYEVITGDVLWEGLGGCAQLNCARIPSVKGVSPNLERLVCACLAAETWNRPTASQIFDYAAAYMQHKPLPQLGNTAVASTEYPSKWTVGKAESAPSVLMPVNSMATYKPVNYSSRQHARLSEQARQSDLSLQSDQPRYSTRRIAIITVGCLVALILVSGIVTFANYVSEEQDFVSCKTKQDYEQFIKSYPASSHLEVARKRIEALSVPVVPKDSVAVVSDDADQQTSVVAAPVVHQPTAAETIVVSYSPRSVHVNADVGTELQHEAFHGSSDASNADDDLIFYNCTNTDDYQAYLNLYPNGRHRGEARQMIQNLASRGNASLVNSSELENQTVPPNNGLIDTRHANRRSTSVSVSFNPTMKNGRGGAGKGGTGRGGEQRSNPHSRHR